MLIFNHSKRRKKSDILIYLWLKLVEGYETAKVSLLLILLKIIGSICFFLLSFFFSVLSSSQREDKTQNCKKTRKTQNQVPITHPGNPIEIVSHANRKSLKEKLNISSKKRCLPEIVPEQSLPDNIGISGFPQEFTGHGHVGDVLEVEVAGTLNQRVDVEVGNGRRPLILHGWWLHHQNFPKP